MASSQADLERHPRYWLRKCKAVASNRPTVWWTLPLYCLCLVTKHNLGTAGPGKVLGAFGDTEEAVRHSVETKDQGHLLVSPGADSEAIARFGL